MLVVTRKAGESIRIGGDIKISIVEIRNGTARLSIEAPREVRILREEVYVKVTEANAEAAQTRVESLADLTGAARTALAPRPTDVEGNPGDTAA